MLYRTIVQSFSHNPIFATVNSLVCPSMSWEFVLFVNLVQILYICQLSKTASVTTLYILLTTNPGGGGGVGKRNVFLNQFGSVLG